MAASLSKQEDFQYSSSYNQSHINRNSNVLLGYPDEIIAQQYLNDVDFTTSKIGGQPNWINCPPTYLDSKCSVCGNPTPLIVQIYAPLENSNYHRTLYVFGCIQQQCWNRKESWKCFRQQKEIIPKEKANVPKPPNQMVNISENIPTNWLSNADDWGSDDDDNLNEIQKYMEQDANDNTNLMNNLSQMSLSEKHRPLTPVNYTQNGTSTINMDINDTLSSPEITKGNDVNANPPSESSGAIGGQIWREEATAEIEMEDTEKCQNKDDIVAVESPDIETCDMNNAFSSNILKYFSPEELAKCSSTNLEIDNQNLLHTVSKGSQLNNAQENSNSSNQICFTPYFLSVDEELTNETDHYGDHELQLYMDYKSKELENEDDSINITKGKIPAAEKSKPSKFSHGSSDGYEKTMPKHGDVLLHKMISTIKRNPGQVLRYTRDSNQQPLFMVKPSVKEIPTCCQNCNGPVICEVQLLSSLIPFLKLNSTQVKENCQQNHCQTNQRTLNEIDNDGEPTFTKELNSFIEFGTIMIYTCQSSCSSQNRRLSSTEDSASDGGYYKEQLVLQSESL